MNCGIKKIIALALVICTCFILFSQMSNAETVLEVRSRGDLVVELQKRLKQWGYYTGAVDGRYGELTRDAVIYFQSKNGLPQTGKVDSATAAKIGISLSSGSSYASSGTTASGDVYLLARLIYGEARGEPYRGKVAVAAVVLNRVKDSRFPNSIASVIYQPGAFSVVSDGQINLAPDADAIRAARDALNGWDPTYGCIYYYNPAKTTNRWIWSRPIIVVIGSHNFCT